MAPIKPLAVLATFLAVSACAGQAPTASFTSLDQKCSKTATTGDMYRDCMHLGLDEARLHSLHSGDGAPVDAVLPEGAS
jgi:hypothetical protein